MDANLTTAIVTASATALVAIVAIVTNNRRLGDMNARISSLETSTNARFSEVSARIASLEDSMNARMSRLESKLDHIEQLLIGYTLDVARIKERLGM